MTNTEFCMTAGPPGMKLGSAASPWSPEWPWRRGPRASGGRFRCGFWFWEWLETGGRCFLGVSRFRCRWGRRLGFKLSLFERSYLSGVLHKPKALWTLSPFVPKAYLRRHLKPRQFHRSQLALSWNQFISRQLQGSQPPWPHRLHLHRHWPRLSGPYHFIG